jgi:hypothetical protein
VEVFISREVRDLDLEQIVVITCDVMGICHFRKLPDAALESSDLDTAVSCQANTGEHSKAPPECRRIYQGPVAEDYSSLFQPVHTPKTWGGRQAHSGGQIGVADSPMPFKDGQYRYVNFIHAEDSAFIWAIQAISHSIQHAILCQSSREPVHRPGLCAIVDEYKFDQSAGPGTALAGEDQTVSRAGTHSKEDRNDK